MRLLINCFDQPVKYKLPKEIDWKVLIDIYKEPAEYLSLVEGIAWLEDFSVQFLKGRSADG